MQKKNSNSEEIKNSTMKNAITFLIINKTHFIKEIEIIKENYQHNEN